MSHMLPSCEGVFVFAWDPEWCDEPEFGALGALESIIQTLLKYNKGIYFVRNKANMHLTLDTEYRVPLYIHGPPIVMLQSPVSTLENEIASK